MASMALSHLAKFHIQFTANRACRVILYQLWHRLLILHRTSCLPMMRPKMVLKLLLLVAKWILQHCIALSLYYSTLPY